MFYFILLLTIRGQTSFFLSQSLPSNNLVMFMTVTWSQCFPCLCLWVMKLLSKAEVSDFDQFCCDVQIISLYSVCLDIHGFQLIFLAMKLNQLSGIIRKCWKFFRVWVQFDIFFYYFEDFNFLNCSFVPVFCDLCPCLLWPLYLSSVDLGLQMFKLLLKLLLIDSLVCYVHVCIILIEGSFSCDFVFVIFSRFEQH